MKMTTIVTGGLLSLALVGAPFVLAQEGNNAAAEKPAAEVQAAAPVELDMNKVGYALGMVMSSQLKPQLQQFKDLGYDVDVSQIVKGIQAGLGADNVAPTMNMAEVQQTMQAFITQVMTKQAAEAQKLQQATGSDASAKFLEENAKKPGVKTTASGLQYKVIKEGQGENPKPTDTVTVDYEGKLINGKVFDSSAKNGGPISFPLNRVIAGWTEGLQLMKPGAEYVFYIPGNLAYGEKGIPGSIPPDATLVFNVTLRSVSASPAAPAPQQ